MKALTPIQHRSKRNSLNKGENRPKRLDNRPNWDSRHDKGVPVKPKPLPKQPNVLRRKVKGIVSTTLPDYVLRRLGGSSRPAHRRMTKPQEGGGRRGSSMPADRRDRILAKIDPSTDSMQQIMTQLYPNADLAKLPIDTKEAPKRKTPRREIHTSTLPAIRSRSSRRDDDKHGRTVTVPFEQMAAMQKELKQLREKVERLELEKSALMKRVEEFTAAKTPKRTTTPKRTAGGSSIAVRSNAKTGQSASARTASEVTHNANRPSKLPVVTPDEPAEGGPKPVLPATESKSKMKSDEPRDCAPSKESLAKASDELKITVKAQNDTESAAVAAGDDLEYSDGDFEDSITKPPQKKEITVSSRQAKTAAENEHIIKASNSPKSPGLQIPDGDDGLFSSGDW